MPCKKGGKRTFFILSAVVIGLFSTTYAAKFESIYLSPEAQVCVNSMQLRFSHLTERIAEDEANKVLGYWVNPFRNIDRAIARQLNNDGYVPCLDKYNRFRDSALRVLNTRGEIAVYGYSRRSMNYFLEKEPFFFSGKK